MAVIPQYFETLNTDGTYYWDDVALKWAVLDAVPTLSALHVTQGSSTWKLNGGTYAAIVAGTPIGGPTVVDLSAINALSIDVYVESVASGQAAQFTVGNDSGSDTISASSPTDGTGAYTLTLDLTTLPGTRADCSLVVGVLAAGVIYIDNLRVPTTGASIAADPGSYTLTGTAAGLKRARNLVAAAGSYALSGVAATLKHASKAAASPGSYALTGTAATLLKTTAGQKVVVGDPGSYALSGQVATLRHASLLSAAVGAYSLTGTPATLVYAGNSTTYPPITGGGYYREHKPQYRIHPEYEDAPPKKKRRKPEPDEQPFIIAPEPIVRKLGEIRPAWNTAAELMRSELEAAQAAKARAEKIKAIVQADDEWLMTG